MKRTSIHFAMLVAAFMLGWAIGPVSAVKAEDVLKYSCSNQVYDAIDREKVEAFTKASGIQVKVSPSSSGSAVNRLMHGYSDVASTARVLHRHHVDYGFVQIPFCKDPLAIITSSKCPVDNITEQQLQGIFAGMISNWSEVGGPDLPITIIVPGNRTAANKNFRRQVMKHQEIAYDFMTWNSTSVIEAVKYFPCGSVSFIARGAAVREKMLKILRVNGLAPTDNNYPYFEIFYYITKGKPKGAVEKFIDFSFSAAGKKIMQQNGMIPLTR